MRPNSRTDEEGSPEFAFAKGEGGCRNVSSPNFSGASNEVETKTWEGRARRLEDWKDKCKREKA